jgi:hypothetical protein
MMHGYTYIKFHFSVCSLLSKYVPRIILHRAATTTKHDITHMTFNSNIAVKDNIYGTAGIKFLSHGRVYVNRNSVVLFGLEQHTCYLYGPPSQGDLAGCLLVH